LPDDDKPNSTQNAGWIWPLLEATQAQNWSGPWHKIFGDSKYLGELGLISIGQAVRPIDNCMFGDFEHPDKP
jgi:hypothetical protein